MSGCKVRFVPLDSESGNWHLSSEVAVRDPRLTTLSLASSRSQAEDWVLVPGNYATFGRIGSGDDASYALARARLFGPDLIDDYGGIIDQVKPLLGAELVEAIIAAEQFRCEHLSHGHLLSELVFSSARPDVSTTMVRRMLDAQNRRSVAV